MGTRVTYFVFCPLIFILAQMITAPENTKIPVNVGVVLDMDTEFAKMGLSCISMALSDFYASNGYFQTRIILNSRDSKGDVVGAAGAALDLLKRVEVQAIIGPMSSMQADFVIELGNKSQVPIISFSATSPALSSIRSSYFIRTTQNDSSQVKAISSIIKAFGWREVVPIYVDNDFGEGIIPYLMDALEEINTRVPYRSAIPSLASDDQIVAELFKLMTMQTRVFVVHMQPSLGSRLFSKAKQLGMMSEGYAWITTDGILNDLNSTDPSVIDFMQGVLGVRHHVPKTQQVESFINRWKLNFQQNNLDILNPHLNVYGLWAYDSATALAMAVEKARVSNIPFQKPNVSRNSTYLETVGVSKNGPKLLQEILRTSFIGLSGGFHIVDGQLQSSTYEIVNVIANGAKVIGFWTLEHGIVRHLNSTDKRPYSTSKSNLSIRWPGDALNAPKGWVIPTNGKKLRIGVPVKDGFSEFVKVIRDLDTNRTTVIGFCIDVFDAAMNSLPYAVPYEYIPFAKPDGEMAGSYNDLVDQVYLGIYDAVVGDTTIVANRSQYVDFSLPYTESGVSMIVPIKSNKIKSAWVFLKPLTWDLWLTTFLSFVMIGVLIWVLEHRINTEFRGPPSHQVGMIFWFSFSTMVFAQKERIVSNLARFLLIIWFLVVLILIQSYTASLTSMLTVQQLQPTIANVKELINNKQYVGYQKGSFVLQLLTQMGFDESRLLVYNSVEECHDLFKKGSGNGGIAAAFDEMPYMKLFLTTYCSKYTMVQPTYKTDGFGFVFPIGSPLVTDVSRAVLNVTQGDKMREIERAWLIETSHCPDSSTSLSSNNLDLGSFWGLFLIVGVVSFIVFIIYLILFLHEHWNIVIAADSSIWNKIVELARLFDHKDLSCHTFRVPGERKVVTNIDGIGGERTEIEVSPRANSPRSPAASSLDNSLNISRKQGTPPHENASSSQQDNTPQGDNICS